MTDDCMNMKASLQITLLDRFPPNSKQTYQLGSRPFIINGLQHAMVRRVIEVAADHWQGSEAEGRAKVGDQCVLF